MKTGILIGLAVVAVSVATAALLPGSLGVLFLTHDMAAKPWGAFCIYELALPLYLLSLALMLTAIVWAFRARRSRVIISGTFIVLLGVSVYGFSMHTSLMFRPVQSPMYMTLDEAIDRFGSDETVVGVLDRNGRPFAYVAKLQRRPHVVYQSEGDAPFVSTHCVLANSSMAYEMTGDFSAPDICISSVIANNLVFYDATTGWSAQQIYNATTSGEHRLTTLPTVMTSLETWKRFYPQSKVWYRRIEWRDKFYLKVLARASVIDPNSPDLVYPLQRPVDDRLPLKAFVMGVAIGETRTAYPLELFQHTSLVEDSVGGEPVVLFSFGSGDFVQLYSRRLDDERVLHFDAAADDRFQDIETRSTWTTDGHCREGELVGNALTPIPHYNKIFWFCWADFFPQTAVYELPATSSEQINLDSSSERR